MNKLIMTAAALSAFIGASADAEVNLDLNIGTPPVVAAPAPVYVAPAPAVVVTQPVVYDQHHRDGDWRYWQEKRDRERWEHDHPGGRWDHDRWAHDHR